MRRLFTLLIMGIIGTMGVTAQVISSFPYTQDFESFPTCASTASTVCPLSGGWVNAPNGSVDDMDWLTDVGGTPSTLTGPTVDHTLGTSTGKYLFLESSSPGSPNKVAHLISPYFDFTNAPSPELSFWYHMYGATQGTMHVDVDTSSTGAWILDVVPSWTDNLDLWQQRVVDLTAFSGKDSVRFRVRGITGTSFTGDMAVDDFLVQNLVNNNIGVSAFIAPIAPFSPGPQLVSVSITNFGANLVSSATINWQINGVPQAPAAFSGSLAAGSSSGPIALGSALFPPGPSVLKAWTTLPNGVADNDPLNDTLEIVTCTGLAGTITVGTGGTLPDLNAALVALNTCGLSGPTTFVVLPGTYAEALRLTQFPGLSATNTLTFDGGSAATTTITYNGLGSFGTVSLDGTAYVTIKNFTLNSTATADAWGVKIINGAHHCLIDSCVINIPPTLTFDACGVSASNSYTAEFSAGLNGSFITISNNVITGGDKGINLDGLDSDRNAGYVITNNIISGAGETGIYLDDMDSIVVSGNTIFGLTNVQADGIFCFDLVDFIINDNNIIAPDYGLYIADGNFDGPATLGQSQIINNMVRSLTDYGMYLDQLESTNVFHNTSYGEPAIRLNDLVGVDIRNNIFVSDNDYAFELDDIGPVAALNYNIYYTPASNPNLIKYGPSATLDVYPSLAAFTTAFPTLNQNSLEGNPFFKSPTDLHLAGALANDVGDNSVGVLTDIDGDPRPLAPSTIVDIGADEYTPLVADIRIVSIDSISSDCGLGNAETISITFSNLGINDLTGVVAGFSINGGPYTTPEVIPGTILSTASSTYTFVATADLSVPGQYVIKAYASSATPADQDNLNDTTSLSITAIPVISSFPYKEDFENGPGGWTSGGTSSSWEFGTPAKTVIQGAASGLQAWTTGGLGAGLYNSNEASFVEGPCFDMTNAPAQSWVAMKVWWQSEFSWDGANLQSSLDDGTSWQNVGEFGDPNNWYNDNTIDGNPGGSQQGWTGRISTFNGSGGWVQASHPLDPSLIGSPNVKFRVAFGSDGSVHDDGFAFDDFAIGKLPDVSLGPDTTYCIGTTLDAGNWGGTYLWSTGDSTQSIVLNNNTAADIVGQVIWVVVVDSLGLRNTDTVTVTIKASLPTVQATQTLGVDCFGNASGQATAIGTGGDGPLSYVWNSNPPQTTALATGLAAGNYVVTVSDSFGCEGIDSVIITEPTALEVVLDSIVDVLCAGESTGEIVITPSGGTAPYTFLWSNGSTDEDLVALPAGTYTGTITDANGCELTSPALTVSEPDSLAIALDALLDASCLDARDGAISITTSGGTAPYTYLWDNGATTEDLTGLAPGDYVGTITDANGCVLVSPTLSIAPTDSLPTADFSFAFQDGATVTFTNESSANAGSYSWDFGDGAGNSTDPDPTYVFSANGSYTVRLIATGACGSDTTTQTIELNSVSISDQLSRAISVFPNPSSGQVAIQFLDFRAERLAVAVYNVHGQEMLRRTVDQTVGSFQTTLDMSPFPAGSYLIKVEVNGQHHVLKQLLKQ